MRGWFENARRGNYGSDIYGPDFIVEGRGKFQSITHVEVKNPVGSAIKKFNNQTTSISRQGRQVGKKILYQQNFWSDPMEVNKLKSFDPQATLAQSPENVLGLIDLYDVPMHEKKAMEDSIIKGSKNNPNIIFINNN
jgi:hypothetical protein